MATATQLITRALTSLGVLAAGETASGEEATNGLVSLNDMIQSWSNENLLIFQDTQVTIPINGATSYTVGASGDVNTSRPVEFANAFYRLNSVDYPVNIITVAQYDGIPNKSSTGTIPDVVYIRDGYPLLTVYPYPVCSSGTLYLETRKPLTEFATLATSASFPVGYERAIRLNLAVELMPEYGVENGTLVALARDAKQAIKRVNTKPVMMKVDIPRRMSVNSYDNIIRG